MSCLNFIILKVNGVDVSSLPHEEAVQLFLQAKEPILVEVIRRTAAAAAAAAATTTSDDDGKLFNCFDINQLSNSLSSSSTYSTQPIGCGGDGGGGANSISSKELSFESSIDDSLTDLWTVGSNNVTTTTIATTGPCQTTAAQSAVMMAAITVASTPVTATAAMLNLATSYIKSDQFKVLPAAAAAASTECRQNECSGNFEQIDYKIHDDCLKMQQKKTTNLEDLKAMAAAAAAAHSPKHICNQILCNHALLRDFIAPEINIEEITLKKSRSDEKLGFTVSYSSGNGSVTDSGSENDDINSGGCGGGAADDDDDVDGGDDDAFDDDACADIYISDIIPNSLAARDGRLRQGDQILQINGHDVLNKDETELLFAENRCAVTLLISRCIYTDDSEFLDSAVYCEDLTHNATSASGRQSSSCDCEQNTFSSKSSISLSDTSKTNQSDDTQQQQQDQQLNLQQTQQQIQPQNQQQQQTQHRQQTQQQQSQQQQQQQTQNRQQQTQQQFQQRQTQQQTQQRQQQHKQQQNDREPGGEQQCCSKSQNCDGFNHANIKAQLESVNKEISLLNSQISNMKLQATIIPPLVLENVCPSSSSSNNEMNEKAQIQTPPIKLNSKPLRLKPQHVGTKNPVVVTQTGAPCAPPSSSSNKKEPPKFPFIPAPPPIEPSEHIYETIPEDSETDSYYSSPYDSKDKCRIEQWLKSQQQQTSSSSSDKEAAAAAAVASSIKSQTLKNSQKDVPPTTNLVNHLTWNRICSSNKNNLNFFDDYENSSSAYNTGGSCNSNPLTFELKADDKNQSSSTLVFRPYSRQLEVIDNCKQCQLQQQQQQFGQEKSTTESQNLRVSKEKSSPKYRKTSSKGNVLLSTIGSNVTSSGSSLTTNSAMYTNVENIKYSIKFQRKLFRKALLQQQNNLLTRTGCDENQQQQQRESKLTMMTTTTTPPQSKSQTVKGNSQHSTTNTNTGEMASNQQQSQLNSQNDNNTVRKIIDSSTTQHQPDLQMVWKVKRRQDGTRYIVRRPIKNQILIDRAKRIQEERYSLTTEDDEAVSEIKVGRYWTRDERKRHVEKSRARRKRVLVAAAKKNLAAQNNGGSSSNTTTAAEAATQQQWLV